ncbi:MAG: 16S rRNA (uracil(1498)-N(3))-methyltransferase [Ahrensia sp.]|nr:16S rRNA (uracil(1498)-N(3))-methyltransferase [Ahrensia sp.]
MEPCIDVLNITPSDRKYETHINSWTVCRLMPVRDSGGKRFFVNHALSADSRLKLDRARSSYMVTVLRMGDGDTVLVFNGHDGEWNARLERSGRRDVTLHVIDQVRAQPKQPELIYCFAPLKQARLDYMVQKATEMGVGALQPVITQYTQQRKLNIDKMRSHVIEAAEQCGVLALPDVREPVALSALQSVVGPDHTVIFCDEAVEQRNPIDVLSALTDTPIALLVGPEGGVSLQEREPLLALDNVVSISLGPRILRADTAAVAALALVQVVRGDWR